MFAAVKSGEGFGCHREEVARKSCRIAVPSVMEGKQGAGVTFMPALNNYI